MDHAPAPHDDHADHAGAPAHHAEHEGLVQRLRERLISIPSMVPTLRLITGLGIAQLLATAILVLLRDHLDGSFSVGAVDGHLLEMPQPVFVVCIVFLALSWSYLLAGALHAHGLVRLLGLGVYTWAQLPLLGVLGGDPRWQLAIRGLLGGVWALGLGVWLFDRLAARRGAHHLRHQVRFNVVLVAAIFLATLGMDGAAWQAGSALNTLQFGMLVTAGLEGLTFLLIPMLFLAGADLADLGDVVATHVAGAVGRRSILPLAALTGLSAAAILVYRVSTSGADLPLQLVGALVVVGVVLLVARAARVGANWPAHVPVRVIVWSTLAYFAVLFVSVLVPAVPRFLALSREIQENPTVGGELTTYAHESEPTFSLRYPSLWRVNALGPQADQAGSDEASQPWVFVDFDGTGAADPAQFWVVGVTAASAPTQGADARQVLGGWFERTLSNYSVDLGESVTQGEWQRVPYTAVPRNGSRPLEGTAWERVDGDYVWLLSGSSAEGWGEHYAPLFETMLDSWTPEAVQEGAGEQGTPASAQANPLNTVIGVAALVAALVAAGVLAWRGRRGAGAGSWSAVSWLFVLVLAVFVFAAYVPWTAKALLGVPLSQVPYLHLEGIQTTVALGTLLMLAVLAATGRLTARLAYPLTLVFILNAALQVVAWVYSLYGATADASRFTVPQAIILVAAGLWDLTMSGEEITNVHGRMFPRHTRVLLFLGYVTLVATTIVYFSSMHVQATGAAAESMFESDQWPQTGVVFLGVPLVVTLFLLRLGGWLASQRVARPLPQPAPPAAVAEPPALVPALPEA